ncbi:uncharacterized protein [Rutidosis leptorrhynchoides]|uniref:uncharacterized protein n=1 Tax=Rutidosis leptorrhynchoides TaxID=125765 RepID=UPI003A98DA9A
MARYWFILKKKIIRLNTDWVVSDCLNNYCKCVFHLYANRIFEKPTAQDLQRLTVKHAQIHGFSGILRILDCMHWRWRNCPQWWKGHYTQGDHDYPSIMLEALLAGEAPPCMFTVNGCTFTKGYNLADEPYPEWATLMKSFKNPIDPKEAKFSKYQASARKDIEREFGVLQGRWTIVQHPARPYYIRKIRRIMLTCIILNNMITEDNGRAFCGFEENYRPIRRARGTFQERVEAHMRLDAKLRDVGIHRLLRNMLIKHVYNLSHNYRIRHDPKINPNNQA